MLWREVQTGLVDMKCVKVQSYVVEGGTDRSSGYEVCEGGELCCGGRYRQV
jgi:hypothetical protein